LFRKQSSDAQKQKLLGNVIISQSIPMYITSIAIFISFFLILIYLTQSHYSRKETVKGYLIPEKGVVKVFSNRTGVITNLYVKEGDSVSRGDKLVKIKNSQSLSTGIELSVALSKEITTQISYLESEFSAL